MKKLLISGAVIVVLLGGALIAVGYVLGGAFDIVSREEVARLPSPDGSFDAVMFEINGGATTSFAYEVHVVEAGKKLSGLSAGDGAKTAAVHAYGTSAGPSLFWSGADHVVIRLGEARKAELQTPTVTLGKRSVAVELVQIADPTPPPGGILYVCCPERRVVQTPDS